jgi:hypothetical protein
MRDPNRQQLEAAARALRPILGDLAFLGGCTTGLFLTDTAAAGLRPTKDVDTITEVASYAEYATLSDRLRELGLTEDTSEGAPLCRWRHGALIIDVMPTIEAVLGFANRWYIPALASVRIPVKLNAQSGDSEREFRASRTLIGAKRRRQTVSDSSLLVDVASSYGLSSRRQSA